MFHLEKRRLRDLLFPSLLAPMQLGIFGPHTIYSANEAEFTAAFGVLVMHLVGPVLALAGTLVVIGLLLPTKLFRPYVALVFAVGLVLWIQGNLLVANYGPLDGGTIDWSPQDWRKPYEYALWAVVPVLAIIGARAVFPVAVFGSGVFLALQTIVLAGSVIQTDQPDSAKGHQPTEAMFELSSDRNVFHIVLDSFHSDLFFERVETDRAEIDRKFSGFIFFADHAGAFPTTIASIPAMLSGTVYRNEEPIDQFFRKQFEKWSLFRTLREGDYRVDSITEMTYDIDSPTNFFRVPRPYVRQGEYNRFAAWQLVDLSLFRHAPHVLRPKIYNDQRWWLQERFGGGLSDDTSRRRHHASNGEAVLAEFTERMRPAVDQPVYKFMHVGVPHPPVTLDANCGFVEPRRFTREAYGGQTHCALRRVTAFLDRLRELDLYERSIIVIASDHGVRLPARQFEHDRLMPGGNISQIAGRAMALLLVKPAQSSGPLRVSYAPSTISDIPATVLDAVGLPKTLPGESALKLDANVPRERAFGNYVWENDGWRKPYFEHLDLFRITGRVRDGNSWTLTDTLYAPDTDVSFRTRGLADPHKSSSGTVYRWSDPAFFLHPPSEAEGFEVTVRSIASRPQEVTIHVGGKVIDRVTLDDRKWVTLRHALPRDETREWIEFRVDPAFRPNPRGSQELGVQTRDLKWF